MSEKRPIIIKQRKGESPDLFAMRAWAVAMDTMTDAEMLAGANWIKSSAIARVAENQREQSEQ